MQDNKISHRVCANAVHRGSGSVRGIREIRPGEIRDDDDGDGGGSEESEFS